MASGRALQVQYSTQDAFRAEYASNISRGGIFVATSEPLAVRDLVEVELALMFCDEHLYLEGEIVHRVPPDMEAAGATPGVAVQFTTPVRELRERLGEHAGDTGIPDERATKTGRRAAPRSRARVRATVALGEKERIEARTRDVSASGLQLEVQGEPLPIGDSIRLTLDHPVTGEKMPIEGRVVRHVTSTSGRVTAMGIELVHADARRTEVASFMNDVQATEHSRRLGAINGPIADLGITDLLQMFGSTVPRGTLTVGGDGADGSIGFEAGQLLWAEIDGLHGQPALETMLSLRTGHFELLTELVEPISGRDDPIPLEGAVLEALCAIDEMREESVNEARADGASKAAGKVSSKPAGASAAAAPGRVPESATFRIDRDAAEEHASEIGQTEAAVLELAKVGMSVGKMLEVIPEREIGVLVAIDSLIARGVLDLE
jgi:Tfp pilus assembly protein PilZ